MGQSLVTVDAFTDVPFAGNPAAVCVLEGRKEDGWMQKVATEMNLSETAFLSRREPGSFSLRWFSPVVEVDLCGHATVASAHVLWTEGHADPGEAITFHTKSGMLKAEKEDKRGKPWIKLDFPAAPSKAFRGSTGALAKALGVRPKYVATYGQDFLVEMDGEEKVRRLSPDFRLLKALPGRGVAVTSLPAASTKARGYDFVSRFFAPKLGIPEDPVTGTAHCGLGPFWAERLGKDEVLGFQASARGGSVMVRMRGGRVDLLGQAVTVMRASLV